MACIPPWCMLALCPGAPQCEALQRCKRKACLKARRFSGLGYASTDPLGQATTMYLLDPCLVNVCKPGHSVASLAIHHLGSGGCSVASSPKDRVPSCSPRIGLPWPLSSGAQALCDPLVVGDAVKRQTSPGQLHDVEPARHSPAQVTSVSMQCERLLPPRHTAASFAGSAHLGVPLSSTSCASSAPKPLPSSTGPHT